MADLYRDAYHERKPVIPKGFWYVHDPDGDAGAGWLVVREERDPDDAAKAIGEERFHNCDYPRSQDLVVERFDGKKWKVRVEAEDVVQFNARVIEDVDLPLRHGPLLSGVQRQSALTGSRPRRGAGGIAMTNEQLQEFYQFIDAMEWPEERCPKCGQDFPPSEIPRHLVICDGSIIVPDEGQEG